jgi:hypothetical protein
MYPKSRFLAASVTVVTTLGSPAQVPSKLQMYIRHLYFFRSLKVQRSISPPHIDARPCGRRQQLLRLLQSNWSRTLTAASQAARGGELTFVDMDVFEATF